MFSMYKDNIISVFLSFFEFIHAETMVLTHLCLASHKRDIGKQCRPRSDRCLTLIVFVPKD